MSDGELTGKTDTQSSVLAAARSLKGNLGGAVVIGYGSDGGAKLPFVDNNLDDGTQSVATDNFVVAPDSSGNESYVVSSVIQHFCQRWLRHWGAATWRKPVAPPRPYRA